MLYTMEQPLPNNRRARLVAEKTHPAVARRRLQCIRCRLFVNVGVLRDLMCATVQGFSGKPFFISFFSQVDSTLWLSHWLLHRLSGHCQWAVACSVRLLLWGTTAFLDLCIVLYQIKPSLVSRWQSACSLMLDGCFKFDASDSEQVWAESRDVMRSSCTGNVIKAIVHRYKVVLRTSCWCVPLRKVRRAGS